MNSLFAIGASSILLEGFGFCLANQPDAVYRAESIVDINHVAGLLDGHGHDDQVLLVAELSDRGELQNAPVDDDRAVTRRRLKDAELDLGRQGAAKKIMIHYMIRYVVIAIVLVIVALTDTLNPLITFAGVMGLKIGAYLNFFAKKVSTWIYGEEILPDLVEIPEEEM